MAELISGSWKAAYLPGQASSTQWGTGINPIHAVHGEGPPLSITGRYPGPTIPTLTLEPPPAELENPEELGYTPEDLPIGEQLAYLNQHPNWDDPTPRETSDMAYRPSWDEDGEEYRGIDYGSMQERRRPGEFPSETVSEGWVNKEHSYENSAVTSDPSQYEMQTSVSQRNRIRNNQLAQNRGTDDPREEISSRITGMKVKPFSRGEREYDMFPYQQTPGIPRPHGMRSRIAGTGYPEAMLPNEMSVAEPIKRDVPPDPYQGMDATAVDPFSEDANPEDYVSWQT